MYADIEIDNDLSQLFLNSINDGQCLNSDDLECPILQEEVERAISQLNLKKKAPGEMASVIWILSAVLYAEFMCAVSANKLLSLDCQHENHGVHGKDSLLKCFLNSSGESVMVTAATWRRPGGKRPLIMFINDKVRMPEDPRFFFKQLQMSGSNIDVSFLVRNTSKTDEGKYECEVVTDRGEAKAVVSLSVTAPYSKPDMSSVPEKDLQEGMEVSLFCNASGGYPVGMIRWYDQNGTDWTRSAVMTVVETTDKSMNLSSKVTLKASSSAPPYRCLVLNNNGVEEGKAELNLSVQVKAPGKVAGDSTAQKGSTAIAVIVIVGSLLCGLLILALLRRRRTQRAMYAMSPDRMEEGSAGLNDTTESVPEPLNI